MAEESQPQDVTTVYSDRQAKYRAKNREKLRERSAAWWRENGTKYREENRRKLLDIQKKWREQNPDIARERGAKWRAANVDRQREHERAYRRNHPDRKKASAAAYRAKEGVAERQRDVQKQWAARNKDRISAKAAKRRSAILNATPGWANLKSIEAIYTEAKRVSQETGLVHHVDHVIPLKSKFVCGLHVECNLRVVSGVDNLSKGNRMWPEQW